MGLPQGLPVVVAQPADVVVAAGGTARFAVRLAASDPTIRYEWRNAFGPLDPPQTLPSVTLKNVQPFDSGEYHVLVKSPAGVITSSVARLQVTPPADAAGENFLFASRSGRVGLELNGTIALDPGGHAVVAGAFSGTVTVATTRLTSAGGSDALIARFNRAGTVLWARTAGGGGDDAAAAAAVDRQGNVHVCGSFSGRATFGNVTLESHGGHDVFLATYDRAGNLIRVRHAGGPGEDRALSVATDAAGNAYITGMFEEAAQFGDVTLTSAGGTDAFVAKFNPSGVALWALRWGGPGPDVGDAVGLDGEARPVVAGRSGGGLNLPGSGAGAGQSGAAFLAKLDRAGRLLWSHQLIGVDLTSATGCVADRDGNHLLTGVYSNQVRVGALTLAARGAHDVFVAAFGTAGAPLWLERAGGGGQSGATLPGGGTGGSIPLVSGNGILGPDGQERRLFWARRDAAGNLLSTHLTGSAPVEFPLALASDGSGTRYLTGYFDAHAADTNTSRLSMFLVALAEPVAPPPPVIAREPDDATVLVGSSFELSVAAVGAGALSYQWRRDGESIPHATNATYAVPAAQLSDAGLYSVLVTDGEGAVISREARLVVHPPEADTAAPRVAITYPAANARLTEAAVVMRGSASDNLQVRRVEFQWNDQPFQPADGTTAWLAALALAPGANVLRVRSVDAVGNQSPIVERIIYHVASGRLTVAVEGHGTVTPDLNGQLLELGRTFTITAVPERDFVFAGWEGGLSNAAPRLTFVMTSNLTLRARFVANPFLRWQGRYSGLFYEGDEVRHGRSGSVALIITAQGAFTGTLLLEGQRLPLRGQFSAEGRALLEASRSGTNGLSIALALEGEGENARISGQISGGGWTAELLAGRVLYEGTSQPVPQAGSYTVVLPASTNEVGTPGGHGFGTLVVDAAGAVRLVATLGDGTKAALRGPLVSDGWWPLHLPLYRGRGSLLGWVQFTNRAADDLHGLVSWIKLPHPPGKPYAAGFATESLLTGARYTPPALKTNRALNLEQGTVTLTGGGLTGPVAIPIELASDNKVTAPPGSGLTLSLNAASGLFTGKVSDPSSGRPLAIKGALLQKQNAGYGFFLGTNGNGPVVLGE
ncbi:MAG TPA: Ig-like domain-containing protein [Methylomirabilota bacterium]|nr:Ig-like domain-containing protein [Methylomirabilota bacterium]